MRYRHCKESEEFDVLVDYIDGRGTIPLCGLCGNSGRMPKITTASPLGQPVVLPAGHYCICPNGRILKKIAKHDYKYHK